MRYKNVEVSGLNIFYREAGVEGAPKLLLLHGFPSSSHQYRDLLTALEGSFHVIAPDYPGFGNSDMPPRDGKDGYTFDQIADYVEAFLEKIGFTEFGLYVQDYGGPVGFRIVMRNPQWITWLIVQNSNAYDVGFTATWDGLRGKYWETRDAEAEKALLPFLERATIKTIYTHGHRNLEKISPDTWNTDTCFMEREGAKQLQLDLFYDYRNNPRDYPKWQLFMRDRQPKTIIFWGQDDIFFTREGGEAYLGDLPRAEMHRLDSGHFALEDHASYIAEAMVAFYESRVK